MRPAQVIEFQGFEEFVDIRRRKPAVIIAVVDIARRRSVSMTSFANRLGSAMTASAPIIAATE